MNTVQCLSVVSGVFLLLVIGERPAEAYIDPGSASYALQVILGVVLGAVFLLRTYWNRIVTAVRSLVSRDATRRP